MLRKKLGIILLLIILIISLTLPMVRADNEEEHIELFTQDNSEEKHEEELDNSVDSSAISSSLERKDVCIIEPSDVVIDYPVDGNLFVMANSVTINSQIGGDAFILAKEVNIGSKGYIFSNLFTCCSNLNISGVIYDLYSCSKNTTITGYVYRDIHSATNTLTLDGTIGRNAYVSVENINFASGEQNEEEMVTKSNTMIYGDLFVESSNNFDIPDQAVIGNVVHSNTNSTSASNYIWDLGVFLSTVLIIWLLMLWLSPKFLSNTSNLTLKKFLLSLGIGILTTIAIALGFVGLLIIGLTAQIAVLGFSLLILLLGIGIPVFIIGLSKFICKKLNKKNNGIVLCMILLVSVIVWLTTLIPIAGYIISLILKFIGLGIIVKYVLPSRKKIKE